MTESTRLTGDTSVGPLSVGSYLQNPYYQIDDKKQNLNYGSFNYSIMANQNMKDGKDGKDGNRNEETKNEEKPNNVTNV